MATGPYSVDHRSHDQIINDIINSISNYNFGDVNFLAQNRKMIAAFLLCGCIIDLLATYRYTYQIRGGRKQGLRFKRFIENYFPSDPYYDKGAELYDWLRCRLVHNYSTDGKYSLGQGIAHVHYKMVVNGATVLDLDSFLQHTEDAWVKYKNELLTDNLIREDALKVHKEHPILVLKQIED